MALGILLHIWKAKILDFFFKSKYTKKYLQKN